MFNAADDVHFTGVNGNKATECIIPPSELLVNISTNSGLRTKKPCSVCVEKLEFKGVIVNKLGFCEFLNEMHDARDVYLQQLRVTEKSDQRCMYMTTVDSSSFHELKQDQSLHVTFAGFMENLVRMLQDCLVGKLEMNLVQVRSGPLDEVEATSYQLQFVEMRSFKNLVHLCLPCRIAPLNVVLFYMNTKLDAMQKRHVSQEHSIQQLQQEIEMHKRRIEQLTTDNTKLRESIIENARSANQCHVEEMQQMQESLRKVSEQRHTDNERSQKTISALQKQLEKLSSEKSAQQAERIKDQKRNEALNEELGCVKSHISNLKEQNERLHAEVVALKNSERQNEMHLGDTRKHIAELQEKLRKYDKAKADLAAELEAEKKISQTKRQALGMATEEISKANEIILRQTQELIKLKKTIGWRTEVALQQEKAIKDKEKLLELREVELAHAKTTIESLRQEIPQQLESMRQFANSLEQKYTEQIKALRERLSHTGKENFSPTATYSAPSTSRRK